MNHGKVKTWKSWTLSGCLDERDGFESFYDLLAKHQGFETKSSIQGVVYWINHDLAYLELQVYADALVKKAYEDWMHAVEYDGKALLGFKQKKKSVTTRSDTAAASTSDPASYGSANSQKQLSLPEKSGQPSSAGSMNDGELLSLLVNLFCFSHDSLGQKFLRRISMVLMQRA